MIPALFLLAFTIGVKADYFLGQMGQNCHEVCSGQGMNCNPGIAADVNDLFQQLGANCENGYMDWWAADQPCYVTDPADGNYHKCLGQNPPAATPCSASYKTVNRICNCDHPSENKTTFGVSISSGRSAGLTTDERVVFAHTLAEGDVGVMTHLWVGMLGNDVNGLTMNYYIDGETTASLSFQPSLAVGNGLYDSQAPYGTKWFGKASVEYGGYNWNFKIPFQKTIKITASHCCDFHEDFYFIVRGSTNIPITIGGLTLPTNAKMNQFVVNQTYQALDFVTFADVPAGTKGVIFQHSLAVSSSSTGFIQGCYHLYTDPAESFPGTVLAAGTDVYFDSGYAFDAGLYYQENAGLTHFNTTTDGRVQMAAYRFHDTDPLYFANGVIYQWRNGDLLGNDRDKCNVKDAGYAQNQGTPLFNPTASNVTSYTWIYTW